MVRVYNRSSKAPEQYFRCIQAQIKKRKEMDPNYPKTKPVDVKRQNLKIHYNDITNSSAFGLRGIIEFAEQLKYKNYYI